MELMYSSQTPADVAMLERAMEAVTITTRNRILEVGSFWGHTSDEIKKWHDARSLDLEFWAIDNSSHPDFTNQQQAPCPFNGAHLIRGDSAEVFHEIPFGLDLALIDGCHCINHVILDTLHYGARVRVGGLMLFHDTSPQIQQTMKDPHGPNIPEFHNSVLAAHDLLGFPNLGWETWAEESTSGYPWGGMKVFLKIQ